EQDFRREVAVFEKVAAAFPARPDSRHYLAYAWLDLLSILDTRGRLEQAREAGSRALAIWNELTRKHPRVARYHSGLAMGLNNLGALEAQQGNLAKARAYSQEAVPRQQQALRLQPGNPDYPPRLRQHYGNLAAALEKLGAHAALARTAAALSRDF